MTPEHMATLHRRAFTTLRAWSTAEFADLLSSEHNFWIGTEHCFALGRIIAGEAELLTIATDPDYQRQGLASAVLDDFIAHCVSVSGDSIFLEVAADNAPAISLYKIKGFAKSGIRTAYYRTNSGQRCDALLFTKRLN